MTIFLTSPEIISLAPVLNLKKIEKKLEMQKLQCFQNKSFKNKTRTLSIFNIQILLTFAILFYKWAQDNILLILIFVHCVHICGEIMIYLSPSIIAKYLFFYSVNLFLFVFFYKLFGAKSKFVSIVVQNTYLIYIVFYSNNIPMLNKILNLITCSQ